MWQHLRNRTKEEIGLAVAIAGVVILALIVLSQLLSFKTDSFLGAILPGTLFEKTNEVRTEYGVHPLSAHEGLHYAARLKAEHMAENGYFAHYAPDGTSPWHWFRSAGYSYLYAGENLALHFSGSEDVVNAWLASETHRENLLDVSYLDVGLGVATGTYEGKNATFVVQLFGLPQPTVQ